jgi:hypothetical protein
MHPVADRSDRLPECAAKAVQEGEDGPDQAAGQVDALNLS